MAYIQHTLRVFSKIHLPTFEYDLGMNGVLRANRGFRARRHHLRHFCTWSGLRYATLRVLGVLEHS